jgi:hypothetical protein
LAYFSILPLLRMEPGHAGSGQGRAGQGHWRARAEAWAPVLLEEPFHRDVSSHGEHDDELRDPPASPVRERVAHLSEVVAV